MFENIPSISVSFVVVGSSQRLCCGAATLLSLEKDILRLSFSFFLPGGGGAEDRLKMRHTGLGSLESKILFQKCPNILFRARNRVECSFVPWFVRCFPAFNGAHWGSRIWRRVWRIQWLGAVFVIWLYHRHGSQHNIEWMGRKLEAINAGRHNWFLISESVWDCQLIRVWLHYLNLPSGDCDGLPCQCCR